MSPSEYRSTGWEKEADRLAARSIAAGEPTGWFDQLYAAARAGSIGMPWDRTEPNPLLAQWLTGSGAGRRAVVVGCGLGADAEFLAARGFVTTGFDVSPTAVDEARSRNPATTVDYRVADLLALPTEWAQASDLVVEIFTVQALPIALHEQASAAVAGLVAGGGSLVVIAVRRPDAEDDAAEVSGPPWPLARRELDGFAVGGLRLDHVDSVDIRPGTRRWRAVLHRPG